MLDDAEQDILKRAHEVFDSGVLPTGDVNFAALIELARRGYLSMGTGFGVVLTIKGHDAIGNRPISYDKGVRYV